MKLNKVLGLAMITVMAVSLTACGGNSSSPSGGVTSDSKPVETIQDAGAQDNVVESGNVLKIQVGYENNTAEPGALAAEKWAELVKERSNGTMELELFPNSALGKKTELIDQMILGESIITVADGAFLADYGVPDFGIFYAPFMFDSWEEQFRVVESDWYKGLNDQLANEAGIRVVSSNWIYGERHFLTKKPVITPDDLSKMKVRVSSNKLAIESFGSLGLSPVAMDMGDVYQSLQAGTIDGVENPISALGNRSFQEVAKNLVKDGHILAVSMWICGEDFFNTLTQEQQQILMETADEAGLYNNALQAEAEQVATQKMLDAGVTITELTDEQKKAWREKSASFFEKAAETLGWSEGLYETVKAAGK